MHICDARIRGSILVAAISIRALIAAPSTQKRIGEIEFFGYGSVDLKKLRSALPVREGDLFPEKPEQGAALLDGAARTVQQRVGRSPSDVAPVCCDERGNWIVFIGVGGKHIAYSPKPSSPAQLPPEATALYEKFTTALEVAVRKGDTEEDHSRGYALAKKDANLRAAELAMRAYAVAHGPLIEHVLASAAKDQQRVIAAEMLGFERQSRSQIDALLRATRDSNVTVRNNAIRALLVLADSSEQIAKEIPADPFIDLLCSGKWTDVNKASSVLLFLTKTREPKLLNELKERALDRLIEIARWKTQHSWPGKIILGRIAGIDEARLTKLAESGQVDTIIAALHRKR